MSILLGEDLVLFDGYSKTKINHDVYYNGEPFISFDQFNLPENGLVAVHSQGKNSAIIYEDYIILICGKKFSKNIYYNTDKSVFNKIYNNKICVNCFQMTIVEDDELVVINRRNIRRYKLPKYNYILATGLNNIIFMDDLNKIYFYMVEDEELIRLTYRVEETDFGMKIYNSTWLLFYIQDEIVYSIPDSVNRLNRILLDMNGIIGNRIYLMKNGKYLMENRRSIPPGYVPYIPNTIKSARNI